MYQQLSIQWHNKIGKKGGQQRGWMPCHRLCITKIGLLIVFPRDIDVLGWFSAGSVLNSCGKGAFLALVGHHSNDRVTVLIPYEGDVLLNLPTLPHSFPLDWFKLILNQ